MAAGINLGALVYDLVLKKGTWEQDIEKAKLDVQSVEKSFNETGQSISRFGMGLTMGITAPLAGAAAAAIKTGMDFDSQMSRVQAIAGATGAELEKMRAQALQLGADTSFSASKAAEGMENLASAGFTTSEVMAAMPGLLDMAAASGADLGVASEIAASILRGFAMDASEAGHVADVLAEASARSNAQVEDMGDAMKYVAPVANAMGLSMESTAAAIGILSDAGIKGSQAGTTLRGALARMTKPTEAMHMVMKDLGLSFYDAQGKMRSMSEIISMLQGSFKGLTEEEQQHAITVLFGQESMSGMLALIEAGPEKLDSFTQGLVNSDGAAKNMATTMLDNLGGSLEELTGSIETAGIGLYDLGKDKIKGAVEGITGLVNSFNGLDAETKKQIMSVAGAAAALGPLLIGTGKITSSLSGALPVFAQVKGGLGGLVTGLDGTAKGFFDNISKVTGFNTVLDGIKTKVGTATGPIKGFIGNFAPLKYLLGPINSGFGMFGKIVGGLFGAGGIVAIALTLLTALAAGASAAGVDVASIITNVVDGVTQFASSFAEKFRVLAPKVLEAMPAMLQTITTGIIDMLDVLVPIGLEMILMLIQGLAQNAPQIITSAIDIVLKLVDYLVEAAPMLIEACFALIIGIVEGLIENADRVIDAALKILVVLIDALVQNLPIIIEKLPEIIMKIVDALIEAAPLLIDAGVQLTIGIAKGLIQALPKLWEAAVELVQRLLEKIKGILGIHSPSTVFADIGMNLIQGLINGIGNMMSKVQEAIGSIAGRISDGIAGAVNNAKGWGSNMISRLSDGITSAKSWVTDAVSGIGSAVQGGVSGILDKARSWGADMMTGLANGINSAKGKVSNAVSAVAEGIKSFLHFTRPDEGPLREYEEWMPHMIEGLTKGIDTNMHTVVDAASKMSQEMADTIQPTVNVGLASEMQAALPISSKMAKPARNGAADGLGYDDSSKLTEAVKRGVSEGIKAAGDLQGELVVNVYEDGLLKRTIREGRRANQKAGKAVLQMG